MEYRGIVSGVMLRMAGAMTCGRISFIYTNGF